MNVYDFDGTIFQGDSEYYLFDYVVNHKLVNLYYRIVIRYNVWKEKQKHHNVYKTRRNIYHALKHVKNMDQVLEVFWDEHMKYIKKFYLEQQKEDDVINSATPDFILIPCMKRLGIKYLIASDFDMNKFEFIGKFNHRQKKVEKFKNMFKNASTVAFYSDSNSDKYMAEIATVAYKVTGNSIEKWII